MLMLTRHHVALFFLFFFNDTATTEIYTLSLHDALPILSDAAVRIRHTRWASLSKAGGQVGQDREWWRSEEHTSELQSRLHLVCRLLLEKKNKTGRRPARCRV